MMKKIMLLDDSALMRRVVSDIMLKAKDFSIVFQASNGLEGLAYLENNTVDLIILDMHMPKMNGVEFLRVLKENNVFVPTVIISGVSKRDTKDTLEALELGALDFMRKPENILRDKVEFEAQLMKMIGAVFHEKKTGIQVTTTPDHRDPIKRAEKAIARPGAARIGGKGKLVALACSTGGPKALQEMIPMLDARINAPIVVVQHMPAGFTGSLAQRIDAQSAITVTEAVDGEMVERGHVYLAKGGNHLILDDRIIKLTDTPPVGGLRPYANHMYESLIDSKYEEIICVVLTGMGADGTEGIRKLKARKRVYVIAQDAQTSTIYGMPRAVAEAGLVDEVRPLSEIAEAIKRQTGVY